VRLSTTGASRRLSTDEMTDLAAALKSGEIYLADIRRGDILGTLHLNVYAPIWSYSAVGSDSVIVGALILELDPETFLYPLIETWPTPSATGETVLVRREDGDVVYLSRLRFRDYTPLTLRLPLSDNKAVAAVMAGNGISGLVMAIDYRDVRVMSVLSHIPGSPWYLVTKIDEDEIATPLKMVMALIFGITAGVILFLGAALLLWSKRTDARFLRMEYEQEKEKRALLERVASERKWAEEQLRISNEQLERTVEERTATIRKLERERLEDEKQVALGRMAARVAHEINNPLTGIKNSFTLVKRAIPPDHRHYEFVSLIERELDRIARIVRQMFELYRQQGEKISSGNPDDIIRDVAMLLSGNARARQVKLEYETNRTARPVLINEDSLRQVLFAVVQNGIEASPPGGHVRIASVAKGEDLIVTVSDQGPGIPEEYRTRIFEPFFTTKEGLTSGGLGLGLSVTRGLVENLGGNLTFECPPGQGTTFRIVFPIRMATVEKVNG
jgi:signal transduction histidine kinase